MLYHSGQINIHTTYTDIQVSTWETAFTSFKMTIPKTSISFYNCFTLKHSILYTSFYSQLSCVYVYYLGSLVSMPIFLFVDNHSTNKWLHYLSKIYFYLPTSFWLKATYYEMSSCLYNGQWLSEYDNIWHSLTSQSYLCITCFLHLNICYFNCVKWHTFYTTVRTWVDCTFYFLFKHYPVISTYRMWQCPHLSIHQWSK